MLEFLIVCLNLLEVLFTALHLHLQLMISLLKSFVLQLKVSQRVHQLNSITVCVCACECVCAHCECVCVCALWVCVWACVCVFVWVGGYTQRVLWRVPSTGFKTTVSWDAWPVLLLLLLHRVWELRHLQCTHTYIKLLMLSQATHSLPREES